MNQYKFDEDFYNAMLTPSKKGGKCIIMSRSDKRFCQGCAAKKYQADKWKKDPEGCKEKEKDRYKDKRKKNGKKDIIK